MSQNMQVTQWAGGLAKEGQSGSGEELPGGVSREQGRGRNEAGTTAREEPQTVYLPGIC